MKLKMAYWDYDRTRPLIDGRVQPKGIDLESIVLRPREAFTRMLEREEFDVAEVSLASYSRLKAQGSDRFAGIPVALSKMFRHSCIYVRSDAGISEPADLRGRRIGVAQLDSTGVIFIKGMLRHDFGITQDQMQWFLGGLEVPARTSTAPPSGHGPVEVLQGDETLVSLFEAGKLDALFSNHIPSNFRNGSPLVRRLFPDYKTVEQDYYRRTGIYPVMHAVVIKGDVYRNNPWIAGCLYEAFCEARDLAVNGLYDTDSLRLALPWLIDHIEETWRVLGKDFWGYGLESNRNAWEALCRYQVEQQLSSRFVPADELFVSVEQKGISQ